MKRKLALVLAVGVMCAPEFAFGTGRVSIYSDAALTQCTLSDASPVIGNIYVAESSTFGATGLRFRIAESSGFTGVWLSESSPYYPIGSSRSDLSLGFGACLVGKFPVLSMTYQFYGTSTCSDLSIAAAVGFPVPICTSCSFGEWPCEGFDTLHVNCSGSFNCNPVPVEPNTWGSVKALYRD
jgi:hypothetical protein